MTTEYSMDALTQILSALDGQKRNPCSKRAAFKAINKKAEALGLTQDDVFDAAPALLGGKDPEEWANDLTAASIARETEEQVGPFDAPAEEEEQAETSWNHPRSPAALGEEALRAEEEERETIEQIRGKQDRIVETIAQLDAEHAAAEDEPEAEEPEEPAKLGHVDLITFDDKDAELVLSDKGAIEMARRARKHADDEPAQDDEPEATTPKRSRENSKQARAIKMLKRPEGATIEQIGEEFGWQKHTVRAFVSATLGKKLGLNITSGKIDGQRTYRIED